MTPLDPSVTEMIERAMVARIATASRTGRPHVNPLYFHVTDGRVRLGTALGTLAVHNVRANPAVEILFEIETDPNHRRMLRMEGIARVRSDPSAMKLYLRATAKKYIITPGGLWNLLRHPRRWKPMRRHVRAGGSCVIEVTPTSAEWLDEKTLDSARRRVSSLRRS